MTAATTDSSAHEVVRFRVRRLALTRAAPDGDGRVIGRHRLVPWFAFAGRPVAPPVAAPTTRAPSVTYRDAVPADVLERIDRYVAVARRRVVATGCPDGRTVRWKQPAGAPDLKRTAATRFVMPDWLPK